MGPDDAVRARTSVDCARVGSLTTYARHPSSQHTCSVAVEPRPDGSVELELARDAVGARQLLARPVATLEVAPVGFEPVMLHGSVRRLPGLSAGGALLFRLDVTAVRVGTPPVLLDGASFCAARPDPLRHDAAAVLEHLNGCHADALAACLRAGGHDAGFVVATGLDAGGLTVTAVGAEGVDRVRLRFPSPVSDLGELPMSIGGALNPRCGCSAARPSRGPGADGR